MNKVDFEELEESSDGRTIKAVVIHKSSFIKLLYKYEDKPFYLEVPCTEANTDAKEGDNIELSLYIHIKE